MFRKTFLNQLLYQYNMTIVIGGGPSGSFYGANAKEDSVIIEDHKEIGTPISCSGIITSSVKDVVKIKDELILNKIKQFKIFSVW